MSPEEINVICCDGEIEALRLAIYNRLEKMEECLQAAKASLPDPKGGLKLRAQLGHVAARLYEVEHLLKERDIWAARNL